jgi:hypothetical protein
MDFNELALEFVKIYYACYPGNLPEDKEKAFEEINKLHGKFKSHLIDKATKKSEDFFSDKL